MRAEVGTAPEVRNVTTTSVAHQMTSFRQEKCHPCPFRVIYSETTAAGL